MRVSAAAAGTLSCGQINVNRSLAAEDESFFALRFTRIGDQHHYDICDVRAGSACFDPQAEFGKESGGIIRG
jgi:hypothetical protein